MPRKKLKKRKKVIKIKNVKLKQPKKIIESKKPVQLMKKQK